MLLNHTNVGQLLSNACQQLVGDLGIVILAPSETDARSDLHPIFQPTAGIADLKRSVMIGCLGPQTDLFYFDLFLRLARLPLPLGLLVEKLAIVHYFADRRLGIWRNLNQVQIRLICPVQCLAQRYNTNVVSVLVNEAHFSGTDLLVDSVIFAANSSSLALVSNTPGLDLRMESGLGSLIETTRAT
jgi:hypothetical protein